MIAMKATLPLQTNIDFSKVKPAKTVGLLILLQASIKLRVWIQEYKQ